MNDKDKTISYKFEYLFKKGHKIPYGYPDHFKGFFKSPLSQINIIGR
jgi:hypothetical protein